jgi:hypothetical protein
MIVLLGFGVDDLDFTPAAKTVDAIVPQVFVKEGLDPSQAFRICRRLC